MKASRPNCLKSAPKLILGLQTVLTGGGLMVDAREDEGAVCGLNIIEYVDVP